MKKKLISYWSAEYIAEKTGMSYVRQQQLCAKSKIERLKIHVRGRRRLVYTAQGYFDLCKAAGLKRMTIGGREYFTKTLFPVLPPEGYYEV